MKRSAFAVIALVSLAADTRAHEPGTAGPPRPVVIPLRSASAEEAARRLTNRFADAGPVGITFDVTNNTVCVRAGGETLRRARAFLRRLDERHRTDNAVVLVRLEHADAARTAALVDAILPLVRLLDEDCDVCAVPNPPTNGILVMGNVADRERVAAFVEWLDGR